VKLVPFPTDTQRGLQQIARSLEGEDRSPARGIVDPHYFKEKNFMSSTINPEAALPSTTQAFEQSDRNPPVMNWGGTDAEGGLLPSPSMAEVRMTPESPAVSPDAGLEY